MECPSNVRRTTRVTCCPEKAPKWIINCDICTLPPNFIATYTSELVVSFVYKFVEMRFPLSFGRTEKELFSRFITAAF
jgi:hypothetical protein